MAKILTGTDKALEEGFKDYTDRLLNLPAKRALPYRWRGEATDKDPVYARVDFGRWIADCEFCGGAEYVDPDTPLFFCFSCGNKTSKGAARQVIFPENMGEIESALLKRKVAERGGVSESERALRSIPVGEPRSWNPGEKLPKRGKHGL